MSAVPRRADDRAISAGWPDLARELEQWQEAGRVATLWWRDDDAATASAELDRLLAAARGVPVAFAVIPGLADDRLAARLHSGSAIAVLQHGWQHANHAPGPRKS